MRCYEDLFNIKYRSKVLKFLEKNKDDITGLFYKLTSPTEFETEPSNQSNSFAISTDPDPIIYPNYLTEDIALQKQQETFDDSHANYNK